jgi:hypothetical protein
MKAKTLTGQDEKFLVKSLIYSWTRIDVSGKNQEILILIFDDDRSVGFRGANSSSEAFVL